MVVTHFSGPMSVTARSRYVLRPTKIDESFKMKCSAACWNTGNTAGGSVNEDTKEENRVRVYFSGIACGINECDILYARKVRKPNCNNRKCTFPSQDLKRSWFTIMTYSEITDEKGYLTPAKFENRFHDFLMGFMGRDRPWCKPGLYFSEVFHNFSPRGVVSAARKGKALIAASRRATLLQQRLVIYHVK